jgi:hypothetical protein
LVLIAGCQAKPAANSVKSGNAPDPEAEIKAVLANLGPDDQRLAEKQKYCPIMPEVRLGEMGTPYKVVVKGETVFVCCRNCLRQARDDPEKALVAMKERKAHTPATAAQ